MPKLMCTSLVLLVISVFSQMDYFSVDSNTVALWRFNEGTGDSIHDASGNGHHGRFSTLPTWSAPSGVCGYGVLFDGTLFAKVENTGAFNLSGSWALEARLYIPEGTSPGLGRILATHMSYGNTTGYMWAGCTGLFEAYNDNGQIRARSSQISVPSGAWTVLKLSYDSVAKAVHFYRNDTLKETVTSDFNGIQYTPLPLTIGAELSSDSVHSAWGFQGILDEVKISQINPCTVPATVLIPIPSPGCDRKPFFNWHTNSQVSTYMLLASYQSDFSNPILILPLQDTFYRPSVNLAYGTVYWKVGDYDHPFCWSPASAAVIQTGCIPLIIPVAPETLLIRRPLLVWHTAVGAVTYKIQIDQSGSFTNPFITLPVPDTFFLPPAPLPYGRIFWRVSNMDYDENRYSAVDTFVITPSNFPEGLLARPVPGSFELEQNYPNPFNPRTAIRLAIPSAGSGNISLKIYNLKGQAVRTLWDGAMDAGVHVVEFNGRADNGITLPTGIYTCKMTGKGFQKAVRLFLMK